MNMQRILFVVLCVKKRDFILANNSIPNIPLITHKPIRQNAIAYSHCHHSCHSWSGVTKKAKATMISSCAVIWLSQPFLILAEMMNCSQCHLLLCRYIHNFIIIILVCYLLQLNNDCSTKEEDYRGKWRWRSWFGPCNIYCKW